MLWHKIQGAGGFGGGSHWVLVYGGSGTENVGIGAIGIDSNNNVCVGGQTPSDGAGGDDMFIFQVDPEGAVNWSRTLGDTNGQYANAACVDSSGNCIMGGRTSTSPVAGKLSKYSSTGSLIWQKNIAGANSEVVFAAGTDSSDNIYVVGQTFSPSTGSSDISLRKFNSSGTLQWELYDGIIAGNPDTPRGIAVTSSGDVYIAAYGTGSGSGIDAFAVKYNSAGTLQWSRQLYGSGTDLYLGCTVDGSGNAYFVGYTNTEGQGSTEALIVKYNSSGTYQWGKLFGDSNADAFYDVAVDSAGNIYCTGNTQVGNAALLIVKYDSSGNVLWSNAISSGLAADTRGHGIVIDSTNTPIVSGRTASEGAGGFDALVARLPADGSGLAVIGDLEYESVTRTEGTVSTLTEASLTFTASGTLSSTVTADSYTDAAAVLTEELFQL